MVKVRNIKKTYGDRTVLDIENLQAEKGEIIAIVGANGSGKSTLLKILAGVLKSDEGETEIEGRMLYMPQQCIPFRKTVKGNIMLCLKGEKAEKEKICNELLRKLNLTELKDKKAQSLSGGECQRMCLARVLANECDVLILDEPSSAADIEGAETIEKVIRGYREQTGCTVIMTTHSPRQARDMADRIVILHKGTIAEQGSPLELLNNPHSEWGKKFIDSWKIDS